LTVTLTSGVTGEPTFTDDAPRLYQRQYDLLFAPHPSVIPRLERFSCQAEYERIRWWSAPARLVPRGPEATERIEKLGAGVGSKAPGACFGQAEAALQTIDLDWRDDHPPPADATFDADFHLVNSYADALLDDEVGRAMLPLVRGARLAYVEGNHQACSIFAGRVRRMYVNSLRGL